MKLTIKERFRILKNRIKCFILPFFGYPTIQNLAIWGSIYVNDIKGVIIKGCVFTPDENNEIEISRKNCPRDSWTELTDSETIDLESKSWAC